MWCLRRQAVSPTRGQIQAKNAGKAEKFYLLCDLESKRKSVYDITALKARNLPKSVWILGDPDLSQELSLAQNFFEIFCRRSLGKKVTPANKL